MIGLGLSLPAIALCRRLSSIAAAVAVALFAEDGASLLLEDGSPLLPE